MLKNCEAKGNTEGGIFVQPNAKFHGRASKTGSYTETSSAKKLRMTAKPERQEII